MHRFTAHDVPGAKGAYREKAVDIEIQQSHSYELKQQDLHPNYQQPGNQQYQEQVYEDPVPVIVLRIPGPNKYALHLQALLQQYLEIRASQYIKALEYQESQGHLMHPQHYVAQQQQQLQFIPMMMYHQQQYYQPELQQNFHQQEPQSFHQPQHHGHPFQYTHQVHHENYHQVPAGDQSYYRQPQVHQAPPQEFHAPQPQHQEEYPTSYINFVTPTYDQGDLTHAPHEEPDHSHLETSENYPSDKHTQVIFKKKKNRVHRPTYTHSKPIVVPDPPAQQYHEEVHHEPEEHVEVIHHNHQPEPAYAYNHNYDAQPESDVVQITERTKGPINYHVLQPTLAPTHEEYEERHHPKRMVPFSKEQFEKARQMMMNKSKRSRGSQRSEKPMVDKPQTAKSS